MTPNQLQALAIEASKQFYGTMQSNDVLETSTYYKAYITGYQRGVEGSAGVWRGIDQIPDVSEDDDWSDLLILGVVAASDNEIPFVTTGKYYDGKWYFDGDEEPVYNVFRVVKWMPLPEYEFTPTTSLRPALEECVKALEPLLNDFRLTIASTYRATGESPENAIALAEAHKFYVAGKQALQTAKEALK